jgi:hypothetical protein
LTPLTPVDTLTGKATTLQQLTALGEIKAIPHITRRMARGADRPEIRDQFRIHGGQKSAAMLMDGGPAHDRHQACI